MFRITPFKISLTAGDSAQLALVSFPQFEPYIHHHHHYYYDDHIYHHPLLPFPELDSEGHFIRDSEGFPLPEVDSEGYPIYFDSEGHPFLWQPDPIPWVDACLRVTDGESIILEKHNDECYDTIFLDCEDTADIAPGMYRFQIRLEEINEEDEVKTLKSGLFEIKDSIL